VWSGRISPPRFLARTGELGSPKVYQSTQAVRGPGMSQDDVAANDNSRMALGGVVRLVLVRASVFPSDTRSLAPPASAVVPSVSLPSTGVYRLFGGTATASCFTTSEVMSVDGSAQAINPLSRSNTN
jgi:hypothetical protein